MVAASAAFGNSFTLPAVFLTTLLPAPLADRALGYAALFLLAWSPCLWSIGLALIGGKEQPGGPAQQRQQGQQQQAEAAGGAGAGAAGGSAAGSPKPLAWRQPRAVDVTPVGASGSSVDGGAAEPPSWLEQLVQHPVATRLGQFVSQVGGGDPVVMGSEGGSRGHQLCCPLHLEWHELAAGQRGSLCCTVSVRKRAWLCTSLLQGTSRPPTCWPPLPPQVLNPPVVAILAGMMVGLTPAGRALLVATQSSGTAAAAGAAVAAHAALPPELGLLQAVVKAALEVGGRGGWGVGRVRGQAGVNRDCAGEVGP